MEDNQDTWQPDGREQVTLTSSLSAALDSAFGIDSSLDGLAQTVERKKQVVSSKSAELEALEAQIKETEERLKEKQARKGLLFASGNDAHGTTPQGLLVGSRSKGQPARSGTGLANGPPNARSSPSSRPIFSNSASYLTQGMPGALPQTPLEIEGDDYGAAGQTPTSHRK